MGIRSAAFGIKCKADHRGRNLPQLLQDRFHISLPLGLFSENIARIESQAQVLYILCLDPEAGPDQLLFELPDHALQFLDVRGIDLPVVTLFQHHQDAVDLVPQLIYTF